jgi:DNA-binding NtrC family response regulator
MTDTDLLKGKKILIVDDEPDVLDVLEELLDMCEIHRAGNFEDAKGLLESQAFDVAILDIMGVNGYGLLEIAKKKNIPALMLTAHAFTPDNLTRSVKDGAAFYIPKEEMAKIADFIIDILKANKEGKSSWEHWQARFPHSYFERTWGAAWKDSSKDFQKTLRAVIVAKNKPKK